MKGKPRQIDLMTRRPWHTGLCALLAVFLLYNPFVAIYCSHSHSSVDTPQRNRATVGSSELQHFSPVQEEIQQSDLNVEEIREEVASPAEGFVTRGFELEEIKVTQPDLAARVWSRPPPIL